MLGDKIYLEHILEAIEQAEEYIQRLTINEFMHVSMVQDAVVRKIEIVGERLLKPYAS